MSAIISASRRTDIPACFSGWLLEQLEKGTVSFSHPYTQETLHVSLQPCDVTALVLWSKNFGPLLPHLQDLTRRYTILFHFTINALDRRYERNTPPWDYSVACLKQIASFTSPSHILWRYDPIILCGALDEHYHLATFEKLAQSLAGYTYRCYTSYVTVYGKIRPALARLDAAPCAVHEKYLSLAQKLDAIARSYGIQLYACCSPEMREAGIPRSHCVDKELIETLTGTHLPELKLKPTRKGCGCYESINIGTYGTCQGGCIYCYAR